MNVQKHFKRHMIAGIVTLVPLVVTGLFIWWAISKTDVVTRYLVMKGVLPVHIPGLGLILSLVITGMVIYFVGLLVSNYIGRKLIDIGETIIDRVPIVKTIYMSVKQVANSIKTSQKGLFQNVVLIEYPKDGIWTVGFVTGVSKGEIQEKTHEKVINVFVPTTPNPTSGLLVMVPEQNLIYTEMTVEEGMKLIVSGGIVAPNRDAT